MSDWVSGLQVGIANLGNSLAAVKKLVLEQGVISQRELADALADDFDGLTHQQLRQRLINGAPKYGDDDDTVDTLLARAYQTYIDELKQYHNPRYGRGPVGGNYYAGTSSISANVPFGAQTMATPDGRKPTPRWQKALVRPLVLTISALLRSLARSVTAYGSDSRRRVAGPETESGNAGERI
ncbi:pyruvate formate lyase family protein [Shigella flexneri]